MKLQGIERDHILLGDLEDFTEEPWKMIMVSLRKNKNNMSKDIPKDICGVHGIVCLL